MFESIINFFKNMKKTEKEQVKSKDAAKERLHLVLMQDRANVSADFLDLMKQEIIEVIKKYIDVDENAIDVRLTNKSKSDGTTGAPALYANIPIVSIKEDVKNGMAREEKENKEEINTKTENIEQNNSEKEQIETVQQTIQENIQKINEIEQTSNEQQNEKMDSNMQQDNGQIAN